MQVIDVLVLSKALKAVAQLGLQYVRRICRDPAWIGGCAAGGGRSDAEVKRLFFDQRPVAASVTAKEKSSRSSCKIC